VTPLAETTIGNTAYAGGLPALKAMYFIPFLYCFLIGTGNARLDCEAKLK
jgi:hypothetical protein